MTQNVFDREEPDVKDLRLSRETVEGMIQSEDKWHDQTISHGISKYEVFIRHENDRHARRVEELKAVLATLDKEMTE
jgi:polyhydroxyalkanoate synthesis regulator phasin